MIEQIEHIKKFALQDNSALTVKQFGEAIARMCDDAIREAVEHSVQRTVEACPDDRHMYYTAFLNYEFCPYCGQRLHSR